VFTAKTEPCTWERSPNFSHMVEIISSVALRLFWFGLGVLFCFLTGCHFVTQAGLQLMIFLPQPPECWDYRHVSLYPAVF
jgi:hypothetical protein